MKTALALLALAFVQDAAKEELIKLVKAGMSESVILAKIDADKPVFSLSADEIAMLKEQKVSDKVLERMIACAPKAPAPAPAPAATPAPSAAPQPAPPVEGGVPLRNDSHAKMFYEVVEKERFLSVSRSKGTEIAPGQEVALPLSAGEWRIAIDGSPTIDTFAVDGGASKLTFKGADTEYIDLVTLIAESSKGRLVAIISSVGRLTEGQRRRDPRLRPPGQYAGMYGPRYIHLPLVSGNVLLGAGIGAIIGHQSGHRTQGALIGAAAGLLLDHSHWHAGWRW